MITPAMVVITTTIGSATQNESSGAIPGEAGEVRTPIP